ncbi:MAG: metal-dependent hydrolase [Sandaracinaceae bacterium]|nr:metal-dependent hydrolase [Sandaracinaceae bacterium]
MDNITHSLGGLVLAEVILEVRSRIWRNERQLPEWAFWLNSILASNLPDLDVAYAGTLDFPIGYSLHHRGYTHTLVVAPLLALIPLIPLLFLKKRQRHQSVFRDGLLLYVLSFLGISLHILMDFLNDYGVHPFWPFDNRWYYGDTLFIIEPFWWVGLSLSLIFNFPSKVRGLLAVPPFAGITLSLLSGLVPPMGVAALLGCALVMAWVSALASPFGRRKMALAWLVGVPMVFGIAHGRALDRAHFLLSRAFPGEYIHDVALRPAPANPFCWSGLAIQVKEDLLIYRRFVLSLWPSVFEGKDCRIDRLFVPESPWVRVNVHLDSAMHILAASETRVERLSALFQSSCRANAFLRFSRAPLVVYQNGSPMLGDARYFTGSSRPFWAFIDATPSATCPQFSVEWSPPIQPLLVQTPVPGMR